MAQVEPVLYPGGQYRAAAGLWSHRTQVLQPHTPGTPGTPQETSTKGTPLFPRYRISVLVLYRYFLFDTNVEVSNLFHFLKFGTGADFYGYSQSQIFYLVTFLLWLIRFL